MSTRIAATIAWSTCHGGAPSGKQPASAMTAMTAKTEVVASPATILGRSLCEVPGTRAQYIGDLPRLSRPPGVCHPPAPE